ncbi:MAG: cytochrome P450 [Chloroflexota bacterium]|nr:cytochrome P450 [Chloroflexota bacterium]
MSPATAIPSPARTLPGATLWAFRRRPTTYLTRLAREHGDVAEFRVTGQRMVLLNHPDYVRDVLVTHHRSFVKGRALERAKELLGEGLLTSEGEFHLRQRRLVQPAFHRQRVAAYGAVMVEHARRLCDRWVDGATLDIAHEMMRLTLGIVAQTLFSADVESEADDVGAALTTILNYFNLMMLPFGDELLRLPIPAAKRLRNARDVLNRTIYAMIEERRRSGEDTGDLLSMQLLARDAEADGGRMTDQQVRDEALTLFLAGHETTANALTWTWYLLSRHPHVEARLHQELDTVLDGQPPTPEQVPALPYARKVLSEAMRLYPPAWVVGRRALVDYPVGSYVVPAGSIVLLSQWVMHRDARYFPDPERFDPERWTPEAQAERPRYSYFPFGAGPRQCIGEGFAWTEGALLLAALAQRWRLRLVPGHPVDVRPVITLRPRHGMRMTLERR